MSERLARRCSVVHFCHSQPPNCSSIFSCLHRPTASTRPNALKNEVVGKNENKNNELGSCKKRETKVKDKLKSLIISLRRSPSRLFFLQGLIITPPGGKAAGRCLQDRLRLHLTCLGPPGRESVVNSSARRGSGFRRMAGREAILGKRLRPSQVLER